MAENENIISQIQVGDVTYNIHDARMDKLAEWNSGTVTPGTVLWSGCQHMGEESITLTNPISDCMNGIVIKWQYVREDGSSLSFYNTNFISKYAINKTGRTYIEFCLSIAHLDQLAFKGLCFIGPDSYVVQGNSANNLAPTLGNITLANDRWMLVEAIAV